MMYIDHLKRGARGNLSHMMKCTLGLKKSSIPFKNDLETTLIHTSHNVCTFPLGMDIHHIQYVLHYIIIGPLTHITYKYTLYTTTCQQQVKTRRHM